MLNVRLGFYKLITKWSLWFDYNQTFEVEGIVCVINSKTIRHSFKLVTFRVLVTEHESFYTEGRGEAKEISYKVVRGRDQFSSKLSTDRKILPLRTCI